MTWTPPFQLKWQMDRSSFTNEAAVISKFILKLQAMGWKAFYNAHFTVSLPSSGSFEHLLTVIYGKRAWSWVSSFFLGACSTEKLLWNKKWKSFQENTIWRFSVWLPCSFTKTYSAPDIYLGIGQILSQQVFNITLFEQDPNCNLFFNSFSCLTPASSGFLYNFFFGWSFGLEMLRL